MTLYRAYIINSDDELQNSVPLECADDEVALKKAKQSNPSFPTRPYPQSLSRQRNLWRMQERVSHANDPLLS